MRPYLVFALLGLSLGLSACAARPPVIPDRHGIRPPVSTGLRPATSSVVSQRSVATDGTLTLELAVETAFINNPSLQADFAAFEAAAQDVPRASSLMDPRVSYTQFVEGVQTRVGEQQFVAGVSQMFPWFGKLRLQGDVARTKAMQSLQSYRASMLIVRQQVKRLVSPCVRTGRVGAGGRGQADNRANH